MNCAASTLNPILIADDNHDDLFLTQWVLQQVGIENPIVTVEDGQAAIAYLGGCIEIGNTPCVVLLDLRMPKRNGFAVLEWLQARPSLAGVRSIVLASSDLPEDRQRAGQLGAFAYFVKYDTASELPRLLRQDCPGIFIRERPLFSDSMAQLHPLPNGKVALGVSPPGNVATA
jgi:CheY-like chemotaxis protein